MSNRAQEFSLALERLESIKDYFRRADDAFQQVGYPDESQRDAWLPYKLLAVINDAADTFWETKNEHDEAMKAALAELATTASESPSVPLKGGLGNQCPKCGYNSLVGQPGGGFRCERPICEYWHQF